MSSAAPKIKAALTTSILPSLYAAPILVSYSDPGSYQPDVIVAAMDMRVSIDLPVMGTARSQEETTELDLVFSVWQAGTDDPQSATEQAFTMLGQLQAYLKVKPNETLNGTCRNSWISSYQCAATNSIDAESNDVTGQTAEITAVLTCKARI